MYVFSKLLGKNMGQHKKILEQLRCEDIIRDIVCVTKRIFFQMFSSFLCRIQNRANGNDFLFSFFFFVLFLLLFNLCRTDKVLTMISLRQQFIFYYFQLGIQKQNVKCVQMCHSDKSVLFRFVFFFSFCLFFFLLYWEKFRALDKRDQNMIYKIKVSSDNHTTTLYKIC